MDLNQIVVGVIFSVLSSGASFVMGGVWWLVKTQKKQAYDLDIAFKMIRQLKSEVYYASDEQAYDELTSEANDGNISVEDGSPLPESTSR